MRAYFTKHILEFKQPSGTSRGVLRQKSTWFIIVEKDGKIGVGECGLLSGLSIDDRPDYTSKLQWTCDNISLGFDVLWDGLKEFPSIQCGLEQALYSLAADNPFVLFPSNFTQSQQGIAINGLIWMGDEDFMKTQIKQKIDQGFGCIKMKIGAIDFSTEIKLLKAIRKEFNSSDMELRVDANGAFSSQDALVKLEELAALDIHSIEQPIKAGNWEQMAELCDKTPLPIALDEELIGIFDVEYKKKLLQSIKPQYVIFKPSLIGGFKGTKQWIKLCEEFSVRWWVTSALESNVGLNALAQWTYGLNNPMPQGLGTGSLYTNNIDSPLEVIGEKLYYNSDGVWDTKYLKLK